MSSIYLLYSSSLFLIGFLLLFIFKMCFWYQIKGFLASSQWSSCYQKKEKGKICSCDEEMGVEAQINGPILILFCFFIGAQNPILQVDSLGLAFASAAYLMGVDIKRTFIIHVDA